MQALEEGLHVLETGRVAQLDPRPEVRLEVVLAFMGGARWVRIGGGRGGGRISSDGSPLSIGSWPSSAGCCCCCRYWSGRVLGELGRGAELFVDATA